MLIKEDLFSELNFRDEQLNAIRSIYYKYFHPNMPEVFDGRAVVITWKENASWVNGEGADKNCNNDAIISDACRTDPLWELFSDLLPFMSLTGAVTKMQPKKAMAIHLDRPWRAIPIYFPISGCTENCVTSYYDYPIDETRQGNRMLKYADAPKPSFTTAIKDKAVLMHVQKWHGVLNRSKVERIALGWHFKSSDWKYEECRTILKNLGYLN